MYDLKSRILIVDGSFSTGDAIRSRLKDAGFSNVFVWYGFEYSSLKRDIINDFPNPDYIIFVGARSGGIRFNMEKPADLISDNIFLNLEVMRLSLWSSVKKLIFFGASCMYPKNSPQPIREEYLFNGPLEETSRAYAMAKIFGYEMCRAYAKQYGVKSTVVVPATIYGPRLSFDADNSHVMSALIEKFYEARKNNNKEVEVWGSGRARREFIYIDDLVHALIFLLFNDSPQLINVGTGYDISINGLACEIKNNAGFGGQIKFNESRPEGVSRKLLDSSKINGLGWNSVTSLSIGVYLAYKWFKENYD